MNQNLEENKAQQLEELGIAPLAIAGAIAAIAGAIGGIIMLMRWSGLFGQKNTGDLVRELQKGLKKEGIYLTEAEVWKGVTSKRDNPNPPVPNDWVYACQWKKGFPVIHTYYVWTSPERLAKVWYEKKEKECKAKGMTLEQTATGTLYCVKPAEGEIVPIPTPDGFQLAGISGNIGIFLLFGGLMAVGYIIWKRTRGQEEEE